ncbi:MAG: PHP domain-containing protein [Deltaproteobacteria bacterium]|nr:PHP domain-containing protein [Deltaproteobacteria bacterium]
METIDLHLHSHCSDGLKSPEELLRLASEAKLKAVALCDHDTVEGIPEAAAAGRRYGVEVLSGVELSTAHGDYRDLHLLGYGFDPQYPELQKALRNFRDHRRSRGEKMLARINDQLSKEGRPLLDPLRMEGLASGAVGRPHLALLLMEKGHAATMEEAFNRYLIPCNEPKRYLPTVEAIPLLHRAGGVAVLAHPLLLSRDLETLRKLFLELIPFGLDGIEAYASSASNDESDRLVTLASQMGLLVTGGSDFHGLEAGEIRIGAGKGNLRIPYRLLEALKKRLPQH